MGTQDLRTIKLCTVAALLVTHYSLVRVCDCRGRVLLEELLGDTPEPLVLERRLLVFVFLLVAVIFVPAPALLFFLVRIGIVIACVSVMVMKTCDIMTIPARMGDRPDRFCVAGIAVVVHVAHGVRALCHSVLHVAEPIAVVIRFGLCFHESPLAAKAKRALRKTRPPVAEGVRLDDIP